MKKKLFILLLLILSTNFLACPPPAPIFRLASNGPDYTKVPCADCQEIQSGRTDCANISSFYVFFDAPTGYTIESASVRVYWWDDGKWIAGTVAKTDIFPPSTTICNHQGWGVQIVPSDIFSGFSPNPGDNRFKVRIGVSYVGISKGSAIMERIIYFLG